MTAPETIKPALAYGWLTGFYDPVVRWTTRERTFKSHLLAQADIRAGHRVLDVGCGTGTLALAVKRACPEAVVTGLDADRGVLARANRKVDAAGVRVTLIESRADSMPFGNGTFERAISSLFFHHLDRAAKQRVFREIHRLLVPGGELHVADWGRPGNAVMSVAFLSVQFLDGFATTADNRHGLLPALMQEAGFREVEATRHVNTPCGTLSLFRALRA
ncbi:MAG: class I SAM-dependent methyltransferase [Opitutaceae bacterium]|nr:class I SAM-dependent methyltransferase [Opitutaceae bacterium]